MKSLYGMGVGTLLVLLFSDPMVDCLSELGNRTGIPPFYVSFILAPLASNASELIASMNYASKKTQKTITISLVHSKGRIDRLSVCGGRIVSERRWFEWVMPWVHLWAQGQCFWFSPGQDWCIKILTSQPEKPSP